MDGNASEGRTPPTRPASTTTAVAPLVTIAQPSAPAPGQAAGGRLTHVTTVEAARRALRDAPSPVVVVPVHNGFDDVVRCYAALFAHTPTTHSILVVDDAGTDRAPITVLDDLATGLDHHLVVLRRDHCGGFVGACNDAFAATAGRDVVVVNSDCTVGPEWLERLSAAASSSSLVATVSTLTNHGTILSVPVRNTPRSVLPDGVTVDDAARRVAAASTRLYPTIPTAVGHCLYLRRSALDLLGGFDPAFGTGYGEEVDFSQRAIQAGLRHIVADDVFVAHRGGASFGAGALAQQMTNNDLVATRYPWYPAAVQRAMHDTGSSLAVALDRARVALTSRRIGLDALNLGGVTSGTEVVIMQTAAALSALLETDGHRDTLLVLHGGGLRPAVRAALEALPGCELHLVHELTPPAEPLVDVVYRPYQVAGLQELHWLRGVGRRVVVNQLDTIAWANPSYFATTDEWLAYRDLTRLTLSTVDGVAFISEAARSEAHAGGLLDGQAVHRLVWCGTDDSARWTAEVVARRPDGLRDDGEPFLLALGASYHHKNRTFALRLLRRLHDRGWRGRLVLAGSTPPHGSSHDAEAAHLLLDPYLRDHVVDLAAITETEKRWLYERAALTLAASTVEGFGLVPFESAGHGVPVVTTRQGSLDEVLVGVDLLDGFDLDRAADLALDLLTQPELAAQHCAAVRACGAAYTWERTAGELLQLFDEVLTRRPNPVLATSSETAVVGLIATEADPSSALGVAFELAVDAARRQPALKAAVSPEGSRRQREVRRAINHIRNRLGPHAGGADTSVTTARTTRPSARPLRR